MSGAGFEPGHKSRRISSLYDENALAQTSTDRCGFGGKSKEKLTGYSVNTRER